MAGENKLALVPRTYSYLRQAVEGAMVKGRQAVNAGYEQITRIKLISCILVIGRNTKSDFISITLVTPHV